MENTLPDVEEFEVTVGEVRGGVREDMTGFFVMVLGGVVAVVVVFVGKRVEDAAFQENINIKPDTIS